MIKKIKINNSILKLVKINHLQIFLIINSETMNSYNNPKNYSFKKLKKIAIAKILEI